MAIINFFKALFSCNQPSLTPPPPAVPQSPVQPTVGGKKLALLVGINKYMTPGNDLQGCVNDVNYIWEFLTSKRGYDPDNVRMLCDERATQQNILERLEWLIGSAEPGDELVFQYSGHGSSVRQRVDGKLEEEECQILCPTDLDWDNPLTDKILASYFKRVPQGAFLTFVVDACHSGSVDRDLKPGNPHPTKARYLAPPLDIAVRSRGRNLVNNRIGWKALSGPTGNVTFIDGQRHMLISGCKDSQTSADAYIGGKYRGAMTASLNVMLDQNDNAPWLTAHDGMLVWLNQNGYDQVPQLSGPTTNLNKRPF